MSTMSQQFLSSFEENQIILKDDYNKKNILGGRKRRMENFFSFFAKHVLRENFCKPHIPGVFTRANMQI